MVLSFQAVWPVCIRQIARSSETLPQQGTTRNGADFFSLRLVIYWKFFSRASPETRAMHQMVDCSLRTIGEVEILSPPPFPILPSLPLQDPASTPNRACNINNLFLIYSETCANCNISVHNSISAAAELFLQIYGLF